MARKALSDIEDDVVVGDAEDLQEMLANTGKGIETHSEDEIRGDAADLEAFMHEKVEIVLGEARDGDSFNVPLVVGTDEVLLRRGVPTVLQRKFVEALQRAQSTEYDQRQNAADPSDIKMIPKHFTSYAFTVTRDSAKGHDWLRRIKAGRRA